MPTAFVLDDDTLTGPTVFPGFPGVWTAGQPVEAVRLVEAGVFASVQEARDRIGELGLPISERRVKAGAGPVPATPNHFPAVPAETAADEEAADESPAGGDGEGA